MPETPAETPPTHTERVFRLLSDGRPHTHRELYDLHVIAHSRVADLRRRGHEIETWREGTDYLYRLVSTATEDAGDITLFAGDHAAGQA